VGQDHQGADPLSFQRVLIPSYRHALGVCLNRLMGRMAKAPFGRNSHNLIPEMANRTFENSK